MKEKILVVDDERNIRLTLRRVIETMGLLMDEAVNGEEAVRKLNDFSYPLMLLDLRMPGMDGMELLRKIRERGNDLKVIIISAHGTVDNAVEAMKLGAVDFLQKPFTSEETRRTIGDALVRRGSFFEPAFRTGVEKDARETTESGPPIRKQEEYRHSVQQVKAAIELRKFDDAILWAEHAIATDPTNAEAVNLLGVLMELRGDIRQALKFYRAAIALDPGYRPSCSNLERIVVVGKGGSPDVGGGNGVADNEHRDPAGGSFEEHKRRGTGRDEENDGPER